MRMNFGKKDEIGEIDFSKIRSGIKKDDIAKDNEALKSIFSKFDKNADGVLSSDEIDSIEEALKQAMGDDDNLSTREAKTLFDSKNRKEDAKNLFLFLKNLASTTVGIKSVSNPVNKEGIKEEVVYEDGRKEILYEDGSKVIETQIAEKSVVSKFNSKGKLVQVVETDNEGTVKTTDFDENGNLKKSQTVKNNGNYIETTKSINGRTLTTIENKELGLVQEYVEGELVKETRGKTVIQYHGSSRTETTIDGDWKQVDNYEDDVLKSKIVSDKTDDGKSKVVTTTYNGEDSVVDTRIDDKRVSQTKVINGITYSINYDGEGNTKIIVQNGESIATLAKKFGCTVEEIISANPDKVKGRGANAYFLVGEEIKIPRELEADLPALQNRKSAEGAQADYKAYDDAIKAEQARQAEQAAAEAEAAQAEAERAEEKQQREAEKARARELAQQFYDIADHNRGMKSMDKMLEFLNANVTSANIVDILNAYNDPDIRKKDSSIIDTVISEVGAGSALNPIAWANGSKKQKAVLTKIIDTLCQAAREAGVSEDTINSLRNEFISSMNEELDNAKKKTDPTKMEIALDSLLGQIMAAKSGVKATSEDEAMQAVAGDFKETNDKATEDYDKAREEDSWIAKLGDNICGWFGCNTREEMRAKLGDNAKKVDDLIEAANNGDKAEFKRIYKELFGVEFDPNLIAASEKANEDYMNAIFAKSQVEKMNTALSQINDSMSFEEIANVIKNLYSNDSEINADEVINEIIKMYTDAGCSASTEEDKKSILLDFINSTKEANQKVLDELTANKTLEELQREAEIIGKSAFGTNDISKMVDEFNQNMVMTDAIGTAAVEIGATVLLQFVPGLGQMAAARLAVSAAKWGVKGAKIAKYAAKAGKFFKALSKLQSGTASASKVVNGVTRVATQAVTAGVATAGVGASKNEELEVIKERIKQNMLFAGAGATSNILAPKLMQIFGVSRQIAVELAEELINAAAAYGITTLNGDSYGTQDAFLDIAAGLIMARVAGGASARHAVKGAEIDVNTPKPDVDVNKNQEVGYDWKNAPEIETRYNADGTITVTAYENGRLVGKAVKDADGNVVKEYKYEYDADGNVTEVVVKDVPVKTEDVEPLPKPVDDVNVKAQEYVNKLKQDYPQVYDTPVFKKFELKFLKIFNNDYTKLEKFLSSFKGEVKIADLNNIFTSLNDNNKVVLQKFIDSPESIKIRMDGGVERTLNAQDMGFLLMFNRNNKDISKLLKSSKKLGEFFENVQKELNNLRVKNTSVLNPNNGATNENLYDAITEGFNTFEGYSYNASVNKNILDDLENLIHGKDYIQNFSRFSNLDSVFRKTKVGDVANVGGKMYVNDGNQMVQLKLSEESFRELFPPVERFSLHQGDVGDCYLVTTLNLLANSPKGRAKLYQLIGEKFEDGQKYYYTKMYNSNGREVPFTRFDSKGKHIRDCNGFTIIEQGYCWNSRTQGLNFNPTETIIMNLNEGGWSHEVLRGLFGTDTYYYSNLDEMVDFIKRCANDENMFIFGATKNIDGLGDHVPLDGNYNIYQTHAYSIIGYDNASNSILITNPWESGVVIKVPEDVFRRCFGCIEVATIN